MTEVVTAWLGLLFGMSGVGCATAFVLKWLRSAGGGLR